MQAMENSTYRPQAAMPSGEQSSPKLWRESWMKESWVRALHKRFSILYTAKFTSCFPDEETLDEWCQVWAQGLWSITAEQLAYAVEKVARECEWPPTVAEFRALCLSLPMPHVPSLPAPRRVKSEFAETQMAEIREMLANTRPAGNWWKAEVLAKFERGDKVSATALRMARA